MANMADFSSLLQLGVGIGIGFSLFRTPFDFRVGRLEKDLSTEEIALRGVASEIAKGRLRNVRTLQIRLQSAKRDLEEKQKIAIILLLLGSAINLAGLIWSSISADAIISWGWHVFLVFSRHFTLFLSARGSTGQFGDG